MSAIITKDGIQSYYHGRGRGRLAEAGIIGKMKIKNEELPCEMCGYIDCVCSFYRYRPQDFIEK